MTEKHILLVGDGNHQFLTNYVRWLRKQADFQLKVDVLSFTPITKINQILYDNIYFRISDNPLQKILSYVIGLRNYTDFFWYKKIILSMPSYDYVHLHYLTAKSYLLVYLFKKYKTSKIILSIWGSDMYRLKTINKIGFLKTCKSADIITLANQQSIDFFKEQFKWEKNNLKLKRFGLAPLENLINLSDSKNNCKATLKMQNEKLAITIGYNMSPAQQHLEILDQFQDERITALRNKIQLVLPVTYGGTLSYKKQIIKKLNQLPFEYTIYDTFLTNEQVAQIRKASDIMIQLQKTDQFSGSMQEHLFTSNVVITGSWLPYETMKKYGTWFIEVDKIEELASLIPDVIKNYKKYEEKTVNNSQAIAALSSWEKNIHDWIFLYKN